MASRRDLAKFLLADEKKLVFWTHKALGVYEGHKQLIPQEIDKCEWSGGDVGVEGELTFDLAVDGVPLDHDAFTVRCEGEPIHFDLFHEKREAHRRFYRLVIKVASERGEFFQKR